MDMLNYGVYAKEQEVYALISSVEHPYEHLLVRAIIRDIIWPNKYRCFYHVTVKEFLDSDDTLKELLPNTFRIIDTLQWQVSYEKLQFASASLRTEFSATYENLYRFDVPAPMLFGSKPEAINALMQLQQSLSNHFIHILNKIKQQNAYYTKSAE